MLRPDWVPAPAWGRLEAVLRGQPAHAADLLADLVGATTSWPPDARERLIERIVRHAESGAALPAAFIRGLSDLLEGDG